MSYEVSVVTHPSADIVKPSIIIEDRSTGDRTIIGNVPSGLQRKCNEMHLKTSRLTNIFFSGILDWESLAGLPGLILTVSDQGVKSLNLYHSGNRILQYMISCWRYFIFRFGMNLKADDTDVSVERSNIRYTPININSCTHYGTNDGKAEDHAKLNELMKKIFPVPANSAKPVYNEKKITNVTLPKSIVNPKRSTNWIITPNSVRGKFLVNEAKNLGCEVQHYKKLCSFKSVTLSDGTVINPEQVLEPTRHFNPLLVLDIPSTEYLQNTISYDWRGNSPNGLPYASVFHFIDDSVADPLSNPDYTNFIKSFGPSTTHFISHKSYCPDSLNFFKTFRVSLKWKSLLPEFFPLPKWSNDSVLKISDSQVNVLPLISGQKLVMKSTTGTVLDESSKQGSEVSMYTPEAAKSIYDEEIEPIDFDDIVSKKEFGEMLHNRNSAESLNKFVDVSRSLKDQVETLVLGTGSALPSTLRNVLCNLVRIPFKAADGTTGFRTIVLDAGENSLGSLRRLYQPGEFNMIMDELSMIYLSHLHADHHLGIIDFIREWNNRQIERYGAEKRFQKLFVLTPWQYDLFMGELNRVDPFIDTNYLCHISCDEFMLGYTAPSLEQIEIETIETGEIGSISAREIEYTKNEDTANFIYQNLGIRNITTCSAHHCEYAYSCSMTFKLDMGSDNTDESNIFKVSYSGDTRPKSAFAYIGEDSDLLIHESTLEDEKFKDAVDKRHSTTSEAVQVGILMMAKKIILTHFSQRYKSFTCSKSVYERLENPYTKEDLIESGIYVPSPPSSPRSNKSTQSILYEDLEIPLEIKSNIFGKPLSQFAKANAANIEILFASDNMKIEYGKLGMQRDIFEKQGRKLERLFFVDEEEVDNSDDESKAAKGAKKKLKQEVDQKKKRKMTPSP